MKGADGAKGMKGVGGAGGGAGCAEAAKAAGDDDDAPADDDDEEDVDERGAADMSKGMWLRQHALAPVCTDTSTCVAQTAPLQAEHEATGGSVQPVTAEKTIRCNSISLPIHVIDSGDCISGPPLSSSSEPSCCCWGSTAGVGSAELIR